MAVEEHKSQSARQVSAAVLTVSDTRISADDTSGRLIRDLLRDSNHRVVSHRIVRDEPEEIRDCLREWIDSVAVQVILISGGTGLAARDITIEVLESILEKKIAGFGELFRSLSFQEIGASAMLSRAAAGICRGTILVAMPGSEPAVRLAMTRLVLPELAHMVWLIS